MSNAKTKKIQFLLTTHLLNCGSIELLLPDNVVLEISLLQDTKHGEVIADDYCCVKASRNGSSMMIDSYNMGVEFEDRDDIYVCENITTDGDGKPVRRVDVV
jgi:hypothetical protein